MNRFFLLAAMLVATVTPGVVNAQLDNIFANPDTQTHSHSHSQTQAPDQDSGAIDISKLLTSAGLSFEMESEGIYLVSSKSGDVSLPVYVYMNRDKTLVWVKVNLDELKGNPGDHADKLLTLMELSGTFGEAFYSFNSNSKMLELYSVFRPDTINPQDLASRIQAMTVQVIQQRDNWLTSEWTTARHVGSWSATMAENTTMTIQLQADGSFQLTNQAGEQVTSISGKYQIEADKLMMKDNDGNEITGEIYFVDGNHFDLSVNNQNLSFERS